MVQELTDGGGGGAAFPPAYHDGKIVKQGIIPSGPNKGKGFTITELPNGERLEQVEGGKPYMTRVSSGPHPMEPLITGDGEAVVAGRYAFPPAVNGGTIVKQGYIKSGPNRGRPFTITEMPDGSRREQVSGFDSYQTRGPIPVDARIGFRNPNPVGTGGGNGTNGGGNSGGQGNGGGNGGQGNSGGTSSGGQGTGGQGTGTGTSSGETSSSPLPLGHHRAGLKDVRAAGTGGAPPPYTGGAPAVSAFSFTDKLGRQVTITETASGARIEQVAGGHAYRIDKPTNPTYDVGGTMYQNGQPVTSSTGTSGGQTGGNTGTGGQGNHGGQNGGHNNPTYDVGGTMYQDGQPVTSYTGTSGQGSGGSTEANITLRQKIENYVKALGGGRNSNPTNPTYDVGGTMYQDGQPVQSGFNPPGHRDGVVTPDSLGNKGHGNGITAGMGEDNNKGFGNATLTPRPLDGDKGPSSGIVPGGVENNKGFGNGIIAGGGLPHPGPYGGFPGPYGGFPGHGPYGGFPGPYVGFPHPHPGPYIGFPNPPHHHPMPVISYDSANKHNPADVLAHPTAILSPSSGSSSAHEVLPTGPVLLDKPSGALPGVGTPLAGLDPNVHAQGASTHLKID